ncbi:MAG TPA: hypothetical protein VK578_10120 [Edaphobacter sp.]|nr:hypothetical protein [Edaphobacter sp.]
MATKKAHTKTPAKPTVSVEEQLAEALAEKPTIKTTKHAPARIPTLGEQVTIGSSQIVYNVLRVGETDVDLMRPGTNLQRFRVPVENLNFIDAPAQAAPSKPAKPAINIEDIRERIATARQSSVHQFSGDIAILKKYLKSKGINQDALDELDSLCEDMEKRWNTAVNTISGLLEDEYVYAALPSGKLPK